jgi:hypothetical protein
MASPARRKTSTYSSRRSPRTRKRLAELGADDFADPRHFVRFGKEPIAVDILPGIDGVDFDAAWERRVEGVIDPQSGLTASFISKQDLISSRLAAGRLRDLADVEELREASNPGQ